MSEEVTNDQLTQEVEQLAKMAVHLQRVEAVFQSCDTGAKQLSATLETMRAIRNHLKPESIPRLNAELLQRVLKVKLQMRGAMVRSHEALTQLLQLIPEPTLEALPSDEPAWRGDPVTDSSSSPAEESAEKPARPGSDSTH